MFEEQVAPNRIRVVADSDHAGCAVTRKSTSGAAARRGGHTVKHVCNLQSTVALSSGESEYYALVKAGKIALGMQALLKDW